MRKYVAEIKYYPNSQYEDAVNTKRHYFQSRATRLEYVRRLLERDKNIIEEIKFMEEEYAGHGL